MQKVQEFIRYHEQLMKHVSDPCSCGMPAWWQKGRVNLVEVGIFPNLDLMSNERTYVKKGTIDEIKTGTLVALCKRWLERQAALVEARDQARKEKAEQEGSGHARYSSDLQTLIQWLFHRQDYLFVNEAPYDTARIMPEFASVSAEERDRELIRMYTPVFAQEWLSGNAAVPITKLFPEIEKYPQESHKQWVSNWLAEDMAIKAEADVYERSEEQSSEIAMTAVIAERWLFRPKEFQQVYGNRPIAGLSGSREELISRYKIELAECWVKWANEWQKHMENPKNPDFPPPLEIGYRIGTVYPELAEFEKIKHFNQLVKGVTDLIEHQKAKLKI
jgi:hypothetical protein